MRSLPIVSFSLVLRLLASTATAAEVPNLAEHPSVASRLALYEIWIGEQMAYQGQPGVVIAIVFEDDLVWARGFGYRDVERRLPATAETVFRIGSISKLFTATAVLQLRDQGKLRLDDAVVEILPRFDFGGRGAGNPVMTVRHLLTHTSGLPRESAFPYWTDRRFPTREQVLDALGEQEAVFEPGSSYQYSNLGIALLGQVVAEVSGSSWEDYVRRRILEPLGMTSTSVRYGELDDELMATGYLIRRDDSQPIAPPTDAQGIAPAADVSSTAVDLARFVSAHLTGGPAKAPLMALATLRDMHRVHWLDPSWTSGRGLGFSISRQGNRTLAGHGGWVAGYRCEVAFERQSGFGVIVVTNSDEGGPGSYVDQAFEYVIPAMESLVAEARESTEVADGERYAGTYHNPWGEETDFVVVEGGLGMYIRGYPPVRALEGALTLLIPDGEHTFRRPDGNDRVSFELRGDGRVARVKVGENYLFPADCGQITEELGCTWD